MGTIWTLITANCNLACLVLADLSSVKIDIFYFCFLVPAAKADIGIHHNFELNAAFRIEASLLNSERTHGKD